VVELFLAERLSVRLVGWSSGLVGVVVSWSVMLADSDSE